MTRRVQLLSLCLLALAGCVTEYKLVEQDSPDSGLGGDGDGDSGRGGSSGTNAGTGGTVTGGNGGTPSLPPNTLTPGDEPAICKRDGRCETVQVGPTDAVDVLFLVDSSDTMEQEQESLRDQLPRLLTRLRSGDDNGDGVQDFPPAKDLHFGVVTSDLGLPGLDAENIEHCSGLGDEGLLVRDANPDLDAAGLCSTSAYMPPFIAFEDGSSDTIIQAANDLACLASVGLDGCGIEQPLESMLKAVWPGNDPNVTFVEDPEGFGKYGQAGPGFPNGDFIRTDLHNPSVVALVMITDEDDCSSKRMDHFKVDASPNGLNTRCFYEGQRADSNLFQTQRYIELFKMLRPGREDLVLFNAIVGVPQQLVAPEDFAGVDFGDLEESNAFYDGILNAPEMLERVDDHGTPDTADDDSLVPSCDRGEKAKAYPPRRIIDVARGLGPNGLVQSICQDDFSDAFDMITDRIASHLGDRCLAEPIARSNGRVACDVYWELPTDPIGSSPTRCDQKPFLTAAPGASSSGRVLCKLNQLPVLNGEPATGGDDGFYYDDFSQDAAESCMRTSSGARITFTPGAQPSAGIDVYLNCDD